MDNSIEDLVLKDDDLIKSEIATFDESNNNN